MNLTEAERDLTAFFAQQLNRTIDSDIFRGQIPAGQNGIAVRIDSVIDSDRMEPVTCNVQLLAKYPDRDDGLNFVGMIPRIIPVWNVLLEHITVKSLFFRGSAAMYDDTDGGAVKTFVSVNLVAVLTA
ncbi:MAG: hypothetical protein E7055_01715 [Lentisphaerae bacterium]|nr:hypothetical protein [Lentisphaerota bacterium]